MLANAEGLHARPAALFARAAAKYACDVTVENKGVAVNAKSILSLLKADVSQGDTITLRCDGPDENEAIAGLMEVIASL